jgi:hypothetical protein
MKKRLRRKWNLGALVFGWFMAVFPATAAIQVAPPFNADYTLSDLGSVPGLPSRYGGLTFKYDDVDTILIGGYANDSKGKLYSIKVVRDSEKHIIGFSGTATFFADAAYNDGGVVFGPGQVLFLARWPVNQLGMTKPGSSITDKIINLDPLGVVSSPGGLNFVPQGFPGAGKLKVVSWPGGQWYTLSFAPDGVGTYNISSATYATTIIGGPEGFIYVPPGSPGFGNYKSMLVSEYSGDKIAAYEIDTNGDPIPGTRVDFVTGLDGAEGAAIDPLTGDFLFSTFGGGDRVIVVRGFAPPPCLEEPVASAGQDQTVPFGLWVNLNGSGSYDPCPGPEPLSYGWSFVSRPGGSSLADGDLVGGKTPFASFLPDVSGSYLLRLTVYDGEHIVSDEVKIDVTGGRPVAEAGPNQNVDLDREATLDGSDSYDPDGNLLGFLWTLVSKPPGSILSDADILGKTTPSPSFKPDVEGVYGFQLVVHNGSTESDPDTVEIHAFSSQGNIAPNARAGKRQNRKINTLVTLDGSESYDPDDGPAEFMAYEWSFKTVPSGSSLLGVGLIDADQVSASFVPDVAGEYVVRLRVFDGLASDVDEVVIVAYPDNVPPNARAGKDTKAAPGAEVILNGNGSFDPDNGPGPLTYDWRFVFLPMGSALNDGDIMNRTTSMAKFTPDVEGAYVLELRVSDGTDSDRDHTMVVATTDGWVEVTPNEGTIGTQFTLTGHHYEFGLAKGKLFMGKRPLKPLSWASESIFIQVKKPNPPGTYDVKILPKKPKGGIQQVIWEPRAFTVRVPEVKEVDFVSASEGYRVSGGFFGTKKGRIYLGDLRCKVRTWVMNPATNESEATFLLPKGVASGTFMLDVVNKVGKGKIKVTIP